MWLPVGGPKTPPAPRPAEEGSHFQSRGCQEAYWQQLKASASMISQLLPK
jgi:hypothetical protein